MTPRDSLLSILSLVIANASPRCEQKALIYVAEENGLLSRDEADDLIHLYNLYDVKPAIVRDN